MVTTLQHYSTLPAIATGITKPLQISNERVKTITERMQKRPILS